MVRLWCPDDDADDDDADDDEVDDETNPRAVEPYCRLPLIWQDIGAPRLSHFTIMWPENHLLQMIISGYV